MAFLHKDLDNDNQISAVITEFIPLHFVVKIESFSLFSENGIDKYECTEFEAGGYKWRLVIYPNGKDCTKDCDNVSVYLSVAEPNSLDMNYEVNAMFGIFLHNQVANNFLCKRGSTRCRFHALTPAWGFSNFISKKTLVNPSKGYLVDDTCVFGVEVFVFESPGTIERLSLTKVAKPYRRSWTISDFSKIKDEWKSEHFTVADQSWYVSLIPGGSGEAKGRSLSIYLYSDFEDENNQSRQKVKARSRLRIKNQTGNKHRVRTSTPVWFDSVFGFGWDEFIPIADMNDPTNGFLVNDCCILEVRITVFAVARCLP